MSKRYSASVALFAVMILLMTVATASAQNLLANPSFETGPTGGNPSSWLAFGNMAVERNSSPQFIPYDGARLLSMWGNFSGPYNVTGIYQEFACNPDDEWSLSAKSRHYSGDALAGDNFVVQKIVFKDAADVEIGAVESVILNSSFATDTWHVNQPITGIAPIGTVQVEAMILYVQAADAGGAGHVDYAQFIYCGAVGVEESSWGAIKSLYE